MGERLILLPPALTENSEAYLSCKVFPSGVWGLNSVLSCLAQNIRVITHGYENQWGFWPPGRNLNVLEIQVHSKRADTQNLICNHSPLAPGKGPKVVWGEIRACGSRERVKNQPQRCLNWVSPLHHRGHPSWVEHSIPYHIRLGEFNSSTMWIPCLPFLWSSCPVKESAAWTQGVSDWVVLLWGRDHFPHIPVSLTSIFPS